MSRLIECLNCGAECRRRGPVQKYCEACSEQKDLLRKRLWARTHPRSVEQKARQAEHSQRRAGEDRRAGAIANEHGRQSIFWNAANPDLVWSLRVAVPFSYAASKNHLFALRRQGHVALRRESRAMRTEITLRLRQALVGRRIAHNKVWLDILVQKPNHRGDAINVVDLVCDAVKDAIPVDDRWFCIRRLDWEIVKANPQLFIGLGQDSVEDCQICSYCGQIKPLLAFNKAKHCPLGVGRQCKDCRRQGRILAKQHQEPAGGRARE